MKIIAERYRTIKVPKEVTLRVNVKECLSDILALLDGCSYGDLFASSRQKMAAWDYWKEFQQYVKGRTICPPSHNSSMEEARFLDELFYFFYNATIDAEFIKYCADKEGENPVEYVLGLLS